VAPLAPEIQLPRLLDPRKEINFGNSLKLLFLLYLRSWRFIERRDLNGPAFIGLELMMVSEPCKRNRNHKRMRLPLKYQK
jgi:hypothetical protein